MRKMRAQRSTMFDAADSQTAPFDANQMRCAFNAPRDVRADEARNAFCSPAARRKMAMRVANDACSARCGAASQRWQEDATRAQCCSMMPALSTICPRYAKICAEAACALRHAKTCAKDAAKRAARRKR